MILSALAAGAWFLLPAGAANMAPVLAARLLPSWDLPVDFGFSYAGKRLLGSHKTWRGIAAGVVAGGLVSVLQRRAAVVFPSLRDLLPAPGYGRRSPLSGACMGLGALAGDLVKSFFKRRRGIPPGRPWFPFDQVDWLLGALAVAGPATPLPRSSVLPVLLAGSALHVATHALGRALGFNRSWI